MTKQECQDIFDGVMLSDGSIGFTHGSRIPYFMIGLSGTDHLDWITSIRSALTTLGIPVTENYPKVYHKTSKGRPYEQLTLCSRVSSLLPYSRWYKYWRKVVPVDIVLSNRLLANWMMGDGSSTYCGGSVYVKFSTCSYTTDEVMMLIGKFVQIGIYHPYLIRNQGLPEIRIGRSDDVKHLMDMVEPYIHESYMYKVKRPVLKGPKSMSITV